MVATAALDVEKAADGAKGATEVGIDNKAHEKYTLITLTTPNRPGLLNAMSAAFRDMGIDILKAELDIQGKIAVDKFYVLDVETRQKITKAEDQEQIKRTIATVVEGKHTGNTPRPYMGPINETRGRKELLYSMMDTYSKNDVLSIQQSIINHVEYTLARTRYRFSVQEAYQATAFSVRDRLIEVWNDTQTWLREADPKRVYYLSMEFLQGRSLKNALYNLNVKDAYTEALEELGYDLEELAECERDAALGNGGLGRLASCFLDSMASLELPAWGYGIRYQYGMFRQTLQDGFQHEQPDYWLTFGNPWEIERNVVTYPVKFFGHVSVYEENGKQKFKWHPGEEVTAVAHDNPIPGFDTQHTINLRLWSAKPVRQFDLEAFNTGDYVQAILARQRAETISSVLYPDDRTYEGRELRLKQQFFFCSASLQDVVRRYRETHDTMDLFADKVAFQLNDTHPVIAVPELMRLLIDDCGLGWTKSWEITTKVFAFTNHTVMPEALEKWPVQMMEKLLPRHMQIIYDINWRFIQLVKDKKGPNWPGLQNMSIIEEDAYGGKVIKMANLACVASHTINGVAAIHSQIIKDTILKEFYELWPEKFQNKTNGVTQRRWLAFCNPPLRMLITETLGTDKWIKDLTLLEGLRAHAKDPAFQEKWVAAKLESKQRLAAKVKELTGVEVNPNALFDVQVKRIHEYKRQLLNVLGVVQRYREIKKMTPEQRKKVVPRVVMLGGKAAPGYEMAKRIIKLVSAVGEKINNDKDVGDLLKLVFLPDYNVSLAEVIVPGTELSQHISTAGTEASGTSNMKFAMNGSLIIGTMDGANVEIAEEIGEENMFIFGARTPEVPKLRKERRSLKPDPRFTEVCASVRKGDFGWQDYLLPVIDNVEGTDFYLVANDFPSYLETQKRVDDLYRDQAKWNEMSILSVAGMAKFSSDRTIKQYADEIWGIQPCPNPGDGNGGATSNN
ncbi:unnamed protein product [Pedinophyceae sp. YPF-701]|nr:unnamed protein product [Pedinophyceae sp. YPF-701]